MNERPAGHPFDNECCADMVTAKSDIAALKEKAVAFEAFIKEMRDAITYRLPLWATFAMSGLSAAVGWLIASR